MLFFIVGGIGGFQDIRLCISVVNAPAIRFSRILYIIPVVSM